MEGLQLLPIADLHRLSGPEDLLLRLLRYSHVHVCPERDREAVSPRKATLRPAGGSA